jgi:preprotein translocase subunit SecG
MWPTARAVAAAVLGTMIGSVSVVVFMLLTLHRSGSGGLGAVSSGLSEAVVLGVLAVALVAVGGHFTLQRLGWMSPEALRTYGPVIFGGTGALIVALWVVRGMVVSGGS